MDAGQGSSKASLKLVEMKWVTQEHHQHTVLQSGLYFTRIMACVTLFLVSVGEKLVIFPRPLPVSCLAAVVTCQRSLNFRLGRARGREVYQIVWKGPKTLQSRNHVQGIFFSLDDCTQGHDI